MGRVLITGVGGFIGSHVAARFLSDGYEVIGIDDFSGGRIENVPVGLELIRGDLAVPATLSGLGGAFDAILHLAGQSSGEISFDDPVADLKKNVVSTLNLIRHGIENSVGRIVYASSMSVYGAAPDRPITEDDPTQPLSCYGVGKLAAEGYLRVYQNRLPFVALRMFNVYGPGQDLENLRQGMVSIFLAQALAHDRIEVKGSLDRFRDFVHVDDVVEAWWRAATVSDAANRVLNVGTGRRTTVGDLLRKLSEQVPGCEISVSGSTLGDQTGIYADTRQLGAVLGLSGFRDLDSGLPEFVEWARGRIGPSEIELASQK